MSVAGSDVIQEVYRIGTNDQVFSTHIAGPNTQDWDKFEVRAGFTGSK